MHQSKSQVPDRDQIVAFATKGAGSNEEDRLRTLLSRHSTFVFPFDRQKKIRSLIELASLLRRCRPRLLVMEGTGLAGGLACMIGRLLARVPYVVSSGDAVAPWVAAQRPLLAPFFSLYERLLYRLSAGFIGWTPYLVGRALTFGAPRAMTAAGWAPFDYDREAFAIKRRQVRERLGIPRDSLVFGIAGSLAWNNRFKYCYGAELVRALGSVNRPDVCALIVGGGSGLEHLTAIAGGQVNRRVFLTGQVPSTELPAYFAAMDVASLPQSVDRVGSFRYTTKISEYLAARLPIVTGQIPLAYDLDRGWLWKLPGAAPWDSKFIQTLAQLMETITPDQLAAKRSAVPSCLEDFDRESQIARAGSFISDLLADRGVVSPPKSNEIHAINA